MSSRELKWTNRRVAWMNGQRDQQKRSREEKTPFHSVFTLNVATVSVCRCSMRQWGPWCTTPSPWPERTWKNSKLYASSSASAAATTTSTSRLPESWVRTVKTITCSHAYGKKMAHTVTHFMTIFNITSIAIDLSSWYAHFFWQLTRSNVVITHLRQTFVMVSGYLTLKMTSLRYNSKLYWEFSNYESSLASFSASNLSLNWLFFEFSWSPVAELHCG